MIDRQGDPHMPHNFKGTPATSAPDPAPVLRAPDPFYLAVDADDIKHLKSLQRNDYGNRLRLWWEPAPKRGQTELVPTHVTVMADDLDLRLEVVALLQAHRQLRGSLKTPGAELFARVPVAERPEITPPLSDPKPPTSPWNRRRSDAADNDDDFQAA
jgi:hypothetical protein